MALHDLRCAVRVLRQHAVTTAVIVTTLALGVGANTAVFSLLDVVALRSPLLVRDADQLYVVNSGQYAAGGPESARMSGPMLNALHQAAPAGVKVAAMSRGIARVYTRAAGERETVPARLQLVSPNLFPVLGVSPALGRLLPDAERAAHEPAVVLSYGYWQRRFGGASDVVGRSLAINGAAFTIAGVGPRDFAGVWLETPVDIWIPLTAQPTVQYSQSFSADGADLGRPWLPQARIWWLHVVARVPPDQVAPATAIFKASLSGLAGRDTRLVLQPFAGGLSRLRQQFSTPLVALMAMAMLVLLTACANVANLLLSRAVTRQRELAVRMALGAGRPRLIHQLLTESLLLVVIASAMGLVFARWGADVLLRVVMASMDGVPPFTPSIDVRVLAFTAGVALVSVVAFGVWPAWRATRVDLASAFAANARTILGGAARPARALVVLQVALSLLLVTGAGLFARSFQKLLDVDLGFESGRVLAIGVDPRLAGVAPESLPETYARVLDSLTHAPEVDSAAFAMCGLRGVCAREDGFQVEGYRPREGEVVIFGVDAVTPTYFSTVGTPLLAGRALNDADRSHTAKVAVVNRTLAERYFGDWRRAVGRRIGLAAPDIEIVGIVEDTRGLTDLKAAAIPSVFVPLSQRPVVPRELLVRATSDSSMVASTVRSAMENAAPGLPIERMEPIEILVQRGLSQERVVVWLTASFGALALGLAALGLFGVLSHATARRRPEIGVRLALGAAPKLVRWSVVRDGLRLVLYGLVLALPLVLIGGRLISRLVFGISPYDPLTVIVAVLVLVFVGIAASAGPARRASRVDPMVALRQD
ncbi:MAG: ABC transporter permease [Acidobacteria bacterium]|nr:ABC transporter permease [Acidobacteriota bacterium]